MDPLLAHVRSQQPKQIEFLRAMVECESPSEDPAAIARFCELFTDRVADIAKVKRVGLHMLCEFDLPGAKRGKQILGIGHSDTVYPMGTLAKMPFRRRAGRLWGPGVMDMKGGLANFVFAMRALIARDIPVGRKVVLLINADEEIGSRSSRGLIEKEARRSVAALVVEPGTGLAGIAKTSRKAIGGCRIDVHGIAAHAGAAFERGASAIVELARQIERIATFTDLKRGVTVNPGVISGGTRGNVIAEHARVHVDVRVPSQREAVRLEKQFLSLKPVDKRCRLEIRFGISRPAMERTPGIVKLYKLARSIAGDLGVDLGEAGSGGGSDGNFTAAVGCPTLDGIGAVGENAHSPLESIVVDRIADRTALLAHLVAALGAGE